MAHYDDLAPCDYFGKLATGRLLAVGWLEAAFPFASGDPGEGVYVRLKEFLKEPWQPGFFMGGHECQFCRYDGFFSVSNVFVPGKGVTYVAPEGIRHYIAAHGYCPPAEFSEAVLACPDMGSAGYFAALRSCGWEGRIGEPVESATEWKRKLIRVEVLKSIGNVLVAQIREYRNVHGHLPATMPVIGEAVEQSGTWTYEIVEPKSHGASRYSPRPSETTPPAEAYRLSCHPSTQDDIELDFESGALGWAWREGNTTVIL
jgi:hypothetical protein